MTEAVPAPVAMKSPLDAAQKIVADLQGMTNDHQALALKFAIETLGLPMPASHAQPSPGPIESPHGQRLSEDVSTARCMDIKSFTAAKAPKSDQQFAAVVAYYYQFEAPEAIGKIDAATMKDAARQAGRKQVKDWGLTLNNAMRTGYLDKAERGAFKLNSVGENLVAITLPGNGSTAQGSAGRTRKKRPKSSPSKKRKRKSAHA